MGASKGQHVRKYGNRNKIVRVRSIGFDAVVSMVASRLNCTYQEAFHSVCCYLTSKEAFSVELADRITQLFRDGHIKENPWD